MEAKLEKNRGKEERGKIRMIKRNGTKWEE